MSFTVVWEGHECELPPRDAVFSRGTIIRCDECGVKDRWFWDKVDWPDLVSDGVTT